MAALWALSCADMMEEPDSSTMCATRQWAARIAQALQAEGINKVSLIAFKSNEAGNEFWHNVGWVERSDVNYYDFVLNEENITNFIK